MPSTIGRAEIRAAHALVWGANADLAAFAGALAAVGVAMGESSHYGPPASRTPALAFARRWGVAKR